MLDENDRQTLNKLLKAEQAAFNAAVEAYENSKSEMAKRAANIEAIKRLMGDESDEEKGAENPFSSGVRPTEPRPGTVGHEIRLLLEANPQISSEEVIEVVQKKFPKSKISLSSYKTWDSYFRTGRYIMDKWKYRIRYAQDPPY